MEFVAGIGIAASVLTASSLIPQLVKIVKERAAQNISLVMLSTLLTGLCLWIYYGMLKDDLIIICSNAFAGIINIVTGILAWYFKRHPASTQRR